MEESKSKPEVWLANFDPPQRSGLLFSADPSPEELCVKEEPFLYFWRSRAGDCPIFAGRETSKNIYGGVGLFICFSQQGYGFHCAVFWVCDLWQLYSFTPAEF